MLDHEVCKAVAVDQDDFLGDGIGIISGGAGEVTGGDEDAFIGLFSGEGPDEALDFFAANVGACLVALCLDVDDVEPKGVFVDDAVDAFVIRFLRDSRTVSI